MKKLAVAFAVLAWVSSSQAALKVASLHPLITDVAQQVAGQNATVVQIIDSNTDPHNFDPSPRQLAKAKGASIYLASGKNLESYLPKLRSSLGNTAKIVEVGRNISSLTISGRDSHYVCCPKHSHGALDPHWWHRVKNMQKAARIIADEFGDADPDNAKTYKANAANYSKQLDQLNSWIKREVSKIPRNHRILTTSHAAFGYFCKEYGFKSLPVKGISAQTQVSASYQAEAISEIRKNGVKAIFPEQRANPKALREIAKETGIKLGGTLTADGASSYEKMMRDNVNKIVAALGN